MYVESANSELYETVANLLAQDGWKFMRSDQNKTLLMSERSKNGRYLCFVKVWQQHRVVTAMCSSGCLITPRKREEMIEFVTRANAGLACGNFVMDVANGRIRYKTSLGLEDGQLTRKMVSTLLRSSVEAMDSYMPALLAVLQGRTDPKTALLASEQEAQPCDLDRLCRYIRQGRDFQFFVGYPFRQPGVWKRATVAGTTGLMVDGELVNLASIVAFVVAYQTGSVLDGKLAFLPLPEGLHWSTRIEEPRRDVLDLAQLAPARVIAEITFGPSASRPHDPTHYATAIRNVSTQRFRVLKFGGYNLRGDKYVLNTITGDYFTADDFVNWYGVDGNGWIEPGQTVSDPNNYGAGKGYWVYFCQNERGDEFIIGERIPERAEFNT